MIPIKGNRLVNAGSLQVVSNPTTQKMRPPIQVRRWARNGRHPDADLENLKNEHLNQIGLYRTKQVFMGAGNITTAGGSGYSSGVRWRFAFHSGPLAHALFVRTLLGIPPTTGNAYVQFDLYSDATESTLVSSTQFYYGQNTFNGSGQLGWQNMRKIDQFIDVSPDTDYYVKISNSGSARLLSMACVELASFTEHFDGYLAQNVTAQGPILDLYRENQATLIKDLWKRGAAQVLNWTTEPGNLFPSGSGPSPFTYKVTTSSTATNILDLTSTTISAATPGWTLDMTGKARLSQTSGVPCVMKAFGLVSVPGIDGVVELKDSGGTVLATCTFNSTTAQWVSSGAFNLPASSAKYDLQYAVSVPGAEFHLWAVSIYEYEA